MAKAVNGLAGHKGDGPPKASAKLSSGILGMKFMQAGPDSEPSPAEDAPETPEPSETARSRHGYYTDEDPGRWSVPGLRRGSQEALSRTSTPSVGYADIYGKNSSMGGRRTYGNKPKGVDPEEMVKHYEDGEKPKAKKTKKPAGKKRLSSEHAENSAHPKQRRKL